MNISHCRSGEEKRTSIKKSENDWTEKEERVTGVSRVAGKGKVMGA